MSTERRAPCDKCHRTGPLIEIGSGAYCEDCVDRAFSTNTTTATADSEARHALDELRDLAMEDREDVDERDDNTCAIIAVLHARVLSALSRRYPRK